MSLTDSLPNHFTGARRLTLTMLTARDRADDFKGLPAGTAKPLQLLAAFQEAEPYLGLPTHAFKLVSWLVKQTMPCDWEERLPADRMAVSTAPAGVFGPVRRAREGSQPRAVRCRDLRHPR
jgi:hypothetical protein